MQETNFVGRPLWLSGQSLLDGRRIRRASDVGRIIWLMRGILVGGVVKGLLGFRPCWS